MQQAPLARVLTKQEFKKLPLQSQVVDRYGERWVKLAPDKWLSSTLSLSYDERLLKRGPRQPEWLR